MRIRVTALLAVAALSLAACGGNDQGDVADEMVKQAADAGMDLDKACVQKLAEGMSDEDVKSLEEGSDLTTSPEGETILARMIVDCGSVEDIAEQFFASLPDDGTVDKTCMAEAMKKADFTGGAEAAAAEAMAACVTTGG